MQIAWIFKINVSQTRNGREVQGSQIRSRVSATRDLRNSVAVYSSWIELWSVSGGILGPETDQQIDQQSIELRSRFWEAFLRTSRAARRQRRGP